LAIDGTAFGIYDWELWDLFGGIVENVGNLNGDSLRPFLGPL
jgi:hypothetical protein